MQSGVNRKGDGFKSPAGAGDDADVPVVIGALTKTALAADAKQATIHDVRNARRSSLNRRSMRKNKFNKLNTSQNMRRSSPNS